jgi:hypothetical protein
VETCSGEKKHTTCRSSRYQYDWLNLTAARQFRSTRKLSISRISVLLCANVLELNFYRFLYFSLMPTTIVFVVHLSEDRFVSLHRPINTASNDDSFSIAGIAGWQPAARSMLPWVVRAEAKRSDYSKAAIIILKDGSHPMGIPKLALKLLR